MPHDQYTPKIYGLAEAGSIIGAFILAAFVVAIAIHLYQITKK